jgi:hypothetical protein
MISSYADFELLYENILIRLQTVPVKNMVANCAEQVFQTAY